MRIRRPGKKTKDDKDYLTTEGTEGTEKITQPSSVPSVDRLLSLTEIKFFFSFIFSFIFSLAEIYSP